MHVACLCNSMSEFLSSQIAPLSLESFLIVCSLRPCFFRSSLHSSSLNILLSSMDHTSDIMNVMDRRLYVAAELGDVEALEKLRQSDPNVLHGRTPAGNSAFHIASYHGHLEFVRKLLRLWKENPEAGIDFVKARNSEGNTVLHEAAKGGHDDVVKYLLEECADLASQLNDDGESALFKAAEEGRVKPLERLLDVTPTEDVYYKRRSDGQTALHRAVARLHTGVIDKLLDKRPQLANQSDEHFRTPLHVAGLVPIIISTYDIVYRPSLWIKAHQITKLLIEKDMHLKPDIPLCYRVDENKQSALHIAAREGSSCLVKEILKYSKDCLEMVDKDGKNALHLAVENAPQIYDRAGRSLKDIISSLVLRRLINCADNNGKTALDIAIEQREKDPPLFMAIVRYLQRQGATRYILQDKTIGIALLPIYDSSMLSVSASLMATVAFAAAFTLPGNIDSNLDTKDPPTPALINVFLFKAFVIFDTFAFVYSVASAIMLLFAKNDPRINDLVVMSLLTAALSLALTFGSAIHLVVAPKCFWLAVFVWIIVFSFSFRTMQVAVHGKLSVFSEHWTLFPSLFICIHDDVHVYYAPD